MKKSHNRLVTKIYYDYNNFMNYRGVRFGGKLDYHYKEKLSDINKKIIRWIYFGILVEHGQHIHLHQPYCKDQHNTHSQASDNRCCLTVWSF